MTLLPNLLAQQSYITRRVTHETDALGIYGAVSSPEQNHTSTYQNDRDSGETTQGSGMVSLSGLGRGVLEAEFPLAFCNCLADSVISAFGGPQSINQINESWAEVRCAPQCRVQPFSIV